MSNVIAGTGAARKARVYYSEAFKTPSWTLVERIRGHKLTLGKKLGQASGRDMLAEINLPGPLQVGPLSFEYRHLKSTVTDSVFTDLWDSYVNDTVFLWLECDDEYTKGGAKGITFPGFVAKMEKSAEDENAITYSVEVVYCETQDEDGDPVEIDDFLAAVQTTTTAAP